jgi:hypothetical protein
MQEIIPADGRCSLHQRFTNVVTPILHQSKAMSLVASIDHFLYILPNVLRQLQEQCFRFLFCEWPHGKSETYVSCKQLQQA